MTVNPVQRDQWECLAFVVTRASRDCLVCPVLRARMDIQEARVMRACLAIPVCLALLAPKVMVVRQVSPE